MKGTSPIAVVIVLLLVGGIGAFAYSQGWMSWLQPGAVPGLPGGCDPQVTPNL